MTTKNKTPFNRQLAIKSELSSETERRDKITEMEKRGFTCVRTYERERSYHDQVATGYRHVKMRNVGSHSMLLYGAVFRRVETDG